MLKQSTFVFKPPKRTFHISKTRDEYNTIEPKKSVSLTKTQKLFNTFEPVRPFARFLKTKEYASGIDPSRGFLHFMNNDAEKPLQKTISPIITEGIKCPKNQKLRWSIGTTYKCNSIDLIPKMEAYKEYFFTERKKNENNDFDNTYIPTDHISLRKSDRFKTIEVEDKNNYRFPFLKMKSDFNKMNEIGESGTFWKPSYKSDDKYYNRSSVTYNIINNKENTISGKKGTSLVERPGNNKKKGLNEFYELLRVYEPNYNPRYNNYHKKYKHGFFRYKGMFTELYDSYIKNGNIYQPFLTEKIKKPFIKRNNSNKIYY